MQSPSTNINIPLHLLIGENNKLCEINNDLKLPVFHRDFCNFDFLKKSLSDTMKHRNGNQYLPVPVGIGNYNILNDVTDDEIKKATIVFKGMNNV